MSRCYRIILGRKNVHASVCRAENYVGVNFGISADLNAKPAVTAKEFRAKWVPHLLAARPGTSKITAGLQCGFLWTIVSGAQQNDIVLSPDGRGNYYVGDVVGAYRYVAGAELPHQRPIRWRNLVISRAAMPVELQHSCGSIGTVADITPHAASIEALLTAAPGNAQELAPTGSEAASSDADGPTRFAFEKYLDEILISNWKHTSLGKDYDLYDMDGEPGRQVPADRGHIDILAVKKDKSALLVVELKRGRVPDRAVGQVQRYMGFVKEELADAGQEVYGAIIGHAGGQNLRRALSVAPNIKFYTYEMSFRLAPG